MNGVLGLLLLLLSAASTYGLSESVCDATQDASVCYGALGGPVMLQLMRNTTGYYLEFTNEKGYTVFYIIGGTVETYSRFPPGKWQVVAAIGTLIINPAERSDSGTYTVMIYTDSWTLVGEHTVNLLIKGLSESVCDATQDASVCYGALGGPVMLQLMRDTTGYTLYFRNEKGYNVFDISSRGRVVTASWFPQGRWQVVGGIGTLIINPAERNDSGTYTVEIYRGDTWTLVGRHTVNLMIKGLSESVCDATQDASVCYGALGGPVMLQLMRNTTGYTLELRNEEGYNVFDISSRGRVVTASWFPQGRWQVVGGIGTLIINPAERNDSGTYTVEIYRGGTWTLVGRHTVNLMIKATPLPLTALTTTLKPTLATTPATTLKPTLATTPATTLETTPATTPATNLATNPSTTPATTLASTLATTNQSGPSDEASLWRLSESVCDATQDASVCYGALGGPVMLQLMRNTTGYMLDFSNEKGHDVFIISSRGTVRPYSPFPRWRWQVVAAIGTLIINPAERSDSGTYTVRIRRGDTGAYVGEHTVNLMIKGENQEVELSPASMSRSRRRRRGLEEGEGPSGDNDRESVIYDDV
ncbi:uncharacterized protein LOC134442941 [Engraulis encrasicolus]|uniref:uncharacterized protein LOC134442941 n=1 Tax=Engraulis encrasicolus TaxID=184585 RepID=UPI002FD7219B